MPCSISSFMRFFIREEFRSLIVRRERKEGMDSNLVESKSKEKPTLADPEPNVDRADKGKHVPPSNVNPPEHKVTVQISKKTKADCDKKAIRKGLRKKDERINDCIIDEEMSVKKVNKWGKERGQVKLKRIMSCLTLIIQTLRFSPDWCGYILDSLKDNKVLDVVGHFYNGPLLFLTFEFMPYVRSLSAIKDQNSSLMKKHMELEIEQGILGDLEFQGKWTQDEARLTEGFLNFGEPHDDLSRLSYELALTDQAFADFYWRYVNIFNGIKVQEDDDNDSDGDIWVDDGYGKEGDECEDDSDCENDSSDKDKDVEDSRSQDDVSDKDEDAEGSGGDEDADGFGGERDVKGSGDKDDASEGEDGSEGKYSGADVFGDDDSLDGHGKDGKVTIIEESHGSDGVDNEDNTTKEKDHNLQIHNTSPKPPAKRHVKPSVYMYSPYINKKTLIETLLTRVEYKISYYLLSMMGGNGEMVFQTKSGVSTKRDHMETLDHVLWWIIVSLIVGVLCLIKKNNSNNLELYRGISLILVAFKEGARNGEWAKISMRKCISEQIPSQKKKIMGVDQLTKDSFSSGQKDLVFIKSPADDTKMSIPGVERPWLSEAEGFILPNHDTVCSTSLPPLKKLDGAEPISGPKTIKSILRSKSTFKAETLKGIIINEPSSALAKDNKSSLALKVNSAPVGKLKSVKIKDDPPLAIVMKELNNLKLQFSKSQSSYSRSNQPPQVPYNTLQNKYKTQFNKSCDLCGLNNHLFENCYKVLFCKKCEKTDHRTCDHAEYISTMNMSQHLKSMGRSSSRSKIPRPSKRFFPPCTHCEEREINPRNPQYAFKRCEACGSSTHTTTDHYDIEWFKRGEALLAKKCNIRKPIWYIDSGCSRHMTGVKSYLHKYMEQPGPKVVFEDDSTCTTKGYGSIKCNGIVFTKFDKKRGTIFNSNKEVVMIAPRDKHIELVNIIRNLGAGMLTRAMAKQLSAASAHERLFVDFLSEKEPKKVSKALKRPGWVESMQDKLNQFTKNKVWTLVPVPFGKTIIGSKWVFRNKRNETGIVIKNKARLVAQDDNQQEGIYYDETFALSNEFPNHVCKLDKTLYGLKQAPRASENSNGTSDNLGPDLSGKAVNETRFQANPKESHLIVVKRIFRYLKSTPGLGLWYPKYSGFDLKGYSDSDYAGCNMDKKAPHVLKQLKTLDSLPSLLHKVTETLNRFATVVENASEATTKDVPLASQATASPAEGEKNTKDAETNLKDKLIDLLGTNVVTHDYNKKLLFDKYCDKMLKRNKIPKITNCEVLIKKGPITLKIYREDGSKEVISNLKNLKRVVSLLEGLQGEKKIALCKKK
nr:hypothetical protein [Tanacetum cinerariifolium]